MNLAIQIMTFDDNYAIAGVIFAKRRAEGERLEPFKVGSVFLTGVSSGYEAITALLARCCDEVGEGNKLIVARSTVEHFRRKSKVENKINVISKNRGITFKVFFDRKMPEPIQKECMLLANDALKRKDTIFAEL